MSELEALRTLVDTPEEVAPEEPIEPTLEVVETEEVAIEPAEDDIAEEVDEIDLKLGDESDQSPKYTAEESLVFKLTKQKKKLKAADSRLEELERENEALKAARYQPVEPQPVQAPAAIPFPDLYEAGIDGDKAKYSQKVHEYIQAVNQQSTQAQAHNQSVINGNKKSEERAHRLAGRASEFIKTNKIKQDSATSTIQAGIQGLDEVLNTDGAALELLDNIGAGSEKLAYYLGRNKDALATAKKLFAEDPRGFKVNTWLATTAMKLNQKNTQHISKAPAPDEALTGNGSSGASSAKLQSMYDKETDVSKLVKLKQQARGLGITLK